MPQDSNGAAVSSGDLVVFADVSTSGNVPRFGFAVDKSTFSPPLPAPPVGHALDAQAVYYATKVNGKLAMYPLAASQRVTVACDRLFACPKTPGTIRFPKPVHKTRDHYVKIKAWPKDYWVLEIRTPAIAARGSKKGTTQTFLYDYYIFVDGSPSTVSSAVRKLKSGRYRI